MDIDSIEKFIDTNAKEAKIVNVHFKDRSTVTGIFVALKDYSELKAKNFWRLVSAKNVEEWKKNNDIELSRLFNGAAFTRLSIVK